MINMISSIFLVALLGAAHAQLSGSVGPTTSYKAKAKVKICDVTDYSDDVKSDIGPALADAWGDCADGGLVYIPPGTYTMVTCVQLKNGQSVAVQLDGIIQRSDDADCAHMIAFRSVNDFEFFSGTSKGAMQGFGYKYIQNGEFGPRFFRFQEVSDFSVHGFAAIDSAAYYFVFDTVANGEIYNIIARGMSNVGETDAFDIWGENIWVHDIEVTNGDECVTVKSPAHNFLIENIYCNLSGGTAIGSLGTGTDISDISYKHLYLNRADGCYLKTNNGDGTVKNIVWDTVIVHGGPYPLTINEAWGADRGSSGVAIRNLIFKNWHGQNSVNSRPVIRLECDPDVPCYDITVEDVALWTWEGDNVVWSCENAYGDGACLVATTATKNLATYTTKVTTGKPYYATSYMPSDLTTGYPTTKSLTIPPVPTTFYPGATPISKLLSLTAAGGI
ncbi:hypothetical protein E8E14_008772 [Neopestalotiopsis sp. 37M]|nr:hypothetical protein E8E14_008772 [Neopestalotiopsis sp. 37M]